MHTLRKLIRTLFSLLGLFLVLVFILRIFSPGTTDTQGVFDALRPLQPAIDHLAGLLTFPFDFVWRWVAPFLPGAITGWFPVTPAEGALGWLGELMIQLAGGPKSDLAQAFHGWENGLRNLPGVLDWRLLISLPIWAYVESTLLGLISGAQGRKARQEATARQIALRDSFRDKPQETGYTSFSVQPAGFGLMGAVAQGWRGNVSALRGRYPQDPLTKLLTKTHFSQLLRDEIQHARQNASTLGVILLDVDDLTALNATYGHSAGDAALVQVALAIQRTESPQGKAHAARYGGEEFAVLLTDATPQRARFMAEAMLDRIRTIQVPESPEMRLTASAGAYTACFVPTNGSFDLTETSLMAKAEAQLLQAKRTGKNQLAIAALP